MQFNKTIMAIFAGAVFCISAVHVACAGYADDRAEIENLMSTYIFALDLKDVEAYANTFTEDGIINHAGGIERGREEIREFIAGSAENARRKWEARDRSAPRPIPNRHIIDNLELEVNGNTATGRAYWTSVTVDENRHAHVSEYGFYEDEYRRVNGKWLFSYRLIVNEFREGREHGVVSAIK